METHLENIKLRLLFSVIPFSLGPLWCVIHIPNDEGQCRLDNPKNKSKIKAGNLVIIPEEECFILIMVI